MRPSIPARRLTLLPLLATTLAACGTPPVPPVANIQPNIARPVVTVPSATSVPPTAIPSPTESPTSVPTATMIPPTPEPTPTPADVSLVTGENSFARGMIKQRPWMVMIDNHADAYPQSGLDQAAMVFEGLAEYGVTRFIALYQDGVSPEVNEIGPVRSTRLYFAQWAMGFHPVYAHAGGSPDGVQLAETTDQFINFEALRERSYTWRDTRRRAPHNLYTKSALLRTFATDKGVADLELPDGGYLFDHVAPASPVEVSTIDYYFLDHTSRAGFRFDPATNRYYRVMRGQLHTDRVTHEQLWTRNVVVMQINEAARPGDEKRRIDQEVVGSGPARVFIAGRSVDATWRKDSDAAPLRFYDSGDNEIVFNVGPIWVAAIASMDRLSAR